MVSPYKANRYQYFILVLSTIMLTGFINSCTRLGLASCNYLKMGDMPAFAISFSPTDCEGNYLKIHNPSWRVFAHSIVSQAYANRSINDTEIPLDSDFAKIVDLKPSYFALRIDKLDDHSIQFRLIIKKPYNTETQYSALEMDDSIFGIYSPGDLSAIRNKLDGNYIQLANVNLEGQGSNGTDLRIQDYSQRGWLPIGAYGLVKSDLSFKGNFDGNNKKISGFWINRDNQNEQGLFGITYGNISKINLEGSSIIGKDNVGSIVGIQMGGNITQCKSNISIKGNNFVGGLAGQIRSNISQCIVTGNVTAEGINTTVGGLVGQVVGNISQSYASGAVKTNGTTGSIGGLVGEQIAGNITKSFAIGSVNSNGNCYIGGLVGRQSTDISLCFASGEVNSLGDLGNVGGLVGIQHSGKISQSYATGKVTSKPTNINKISIIGGLVGQSSGNIDQSYVTNEVICSISNNTNLGSFIGKKSNGTVSTSYYYKRNLNGVGLGELIGILPIDDHGKIINFQEPWYTSDNLSWPQFDSTWWSNWLDKDPQTRISLP